MELIAERESKVPVVETVLSDGDKIKSLKTDNTYKLFRKKLKTNFKIVWRDITIGYVLMICSLVTFMLIEYNTSNLILLIALVPIWGVFVAFWFAYLQLFVHEAAHFNIHKDKKTNDLLANALLCIYVGVDIKSYRKIHWEHHVNLGTKHDTEHSYFNALSWTFLAKVLLGIHAVQIILGRFNQQKSKPTENNNGRMIALLRGIIFQLILIGLMVFNGFYLSALVWIIAVGLYPFFATVRQILEHRDEHAHEEANFFEEHHGETNRIFKDSFFSFFFGGAGFNRHFIHHLDPQVSYTNLPEIEGFLEASPKYHTIINDKKTSYLETFIKLLSR